MLIANAESAERAHPPSAFREGSVFYQSGGRSIRVETYLPNDGARHPAVLVLYGSGGTLIGKQEMVDFARKLAANGVGAFLIHYFNRTGTVAVAVDRTIFAHWPEWAATVRDGVDFVSVHPRVNGKALGVFGYSLGGFLAVAESTADDRITAVAEIAGGVFDNERGRAKRFPPMLILHGREDQRVPILQVDRLRAEARRFGAAPEVKIYDGEGHRLSPRALAGAQGLALQFLKRRLPR
jgi:dienelactone hydrolase